MLCFALAFFLPSSHICNIIGDLENWWQPKCPTIREWLHKLYYIRALDWVRACSVTSVGSNSVTPWTVACQVPLSMGFSRQEYYSGLPFSPQGDLHDPEIEPTSLASPALAGRFFTTSITWEYWKSIQEMGQACICYCGRVSKMIVGWKKKELAG